VDTTPPLVSVIMPVFNAEKYLGQAVESILNQHYQQFEFLIIDDGSTDGSRKILDEYSRLDKRIHLIRQPGNQGLIAALNLGIDTARGKYIARMDADDISVLERFSKQVEYLELNPEVGILGGKIQYMDTSGNLGHVPVSFHGDLSIRWHCLFESPFFHPVVMFRKALVDRYDLRYDPAALHVEDFDFWSRFLLRTKGENLGNILLYYRIHSDSVSMRETALQNEMASVISSQAISRHLSNLAIPKETTLHLSNSIRGVTDEAKRHRAYLYHVYLLIWNEFRRLYQEESGIAELGQEVIAWSARMILYPPAQRGSLRALWQLTKVEWKWPYYLVRAIPYFIRRRL
jgi:glycosyltransferase involved in cell wall biosynthesis